MLEKETRERHFCSEGGVPATRRAMQWARGLLPPGGNVPQMLTSIRCISHCSPRSAIYCRKGFTPRG